MSYISQEDYKNLMFKFQKGTPKGILKEDFERPSKREMEEEDELGRITDAVERVFANDSLIRRDEVDALAEDIRNAWSKSRGYGRGDEIDFVIEYLTDWAHEERSKHFQHNEKPSTGTELETIWGDNWKQWIIDAANSLEEGNAFTAGLAKAKKGQEFKVGGKTVKDTSNYDADIKEGVCPVCGMPAGECNCETGMDESHPANDKWYDDFENGLQNLVNNKYISPLEYKHYMKALDHIDPIDQYGTMAGHDAAKEFVDDLRTKSQMDADDYQWKQEHGGYDFGEAENEKPNMHDPDTVAKIVVQKHGAELKPLFDKYQASFEEYIQAIRKYDNKDPEFREIAAANNKLTKEFQNIAINWAGHEMLEAGMNKTAVSNLLSGYGYFEDWLSDYVTAINKELKGNVEEGLHMPPLQATGQTVDTVEENSNEAAPYGFAVLSPDERQQLKEYINSIKTIKEEIAKLTSKAGKKVKEGDLGGDRTNLTMSTNTSKNIWEADSEAHERMESLISTKLHDAFHKVTGMIMQELLDDGFNEGDIKLFLQHEIEEKAKEAINAQHDF